MPIMEKKQYIDIELVKDLMQKQQLDNKKMAEKMEVSPAMLKRLFRGADQTHLHCNVLLKIARALGVTTQSLLHKDYRS